MVLNKVFFVTRYVYYYKYACHLSQVSQLQTATRIRCSSHTWFMEHSVAWTKALIIVWNQCIFRMKCQGSILSTAINPALCTEIGISTKLFLLYYRYIQYTYIHTSAQIRIMTQSIIASRQSRIYGITPEEINDFNLIIK